MPFPYFAYGRRGAPQVFNFPQRVQGTSGIGKSTWLKPVGCSFHLFFIVGAGGAGGPCGLVPLTGGGGGGSGSVTSILAQDNVVPDALHITIGWGGSEALSSENTILETVGASSTLLTAPGGANGVSGDSTGAGGAGGTAVAETPWTRQVMIFTTSAGVNGAAGTAVAAGADSTAGIISNGPSGGTTTTGNVVSSFGYPDVAGVAVDLERAGYLIMSPFLSVGSVRSMGVISSGTWIRTPGQGGSGAIADGNIRYGMSGGCGLVMIWSW